MTLACSAHAKSLGFQDDIQRLVPGHFKSQGQAAADGVIDHNVQSGEVSNELCTESHILEIQ
jgi:hypothetical protein